MHRPAGWLAATLCLTFSVERKNAARDSSAQMQFGDSDIGTDSCNKFWWWHRKQLSFAEPPNTQKQSPNKVGGVQKVLGQTNAAGIGIMCQGKGAACDLVLEAGFPMKHLQPARCCALQIASKKGLHTRKGARLTSHWKKLGDSLTWLLQDCLSIPHLS